MTSRNYVDKSAAEAGGRAAFMLLVALALTLPLQSQQSAQEIADRSDDDGARRRPGIGQASATAVEVSERAHRQCALAKVRAS